MSYRVELDIFCGPMDLLLYLVRRNEVDVLDLPIAVITAQFNEYLEVIELLDLEIAGEFVVMASTLVEVKSRLVLPQPEVEETPEAELDEDPRGELIQQLLAYKRYKDAAKGLEDRAAEWQDRFPRLTNDQPRRSQNPSADHIKEVELWDLVSALSRVLRRKDVQQEASIRYDDTPISVYMERITTRVRTEGRVAFSSFFEGTNLRSRIVGIFLAILELLRHHAFRAEQPAEFGEIWVLPPSAEATACSAADATAALERHLPDLLADRDGEVA